MSPRLVVMTTNEASPERIAYMSYARDEVLYGQRGSFESMLRRKSLTGRARAAVERELSAVNAAIAIKEERER